MNSIQSKLKKLRLMNNLTQEELANRLGIGRDAVIRIEKGTRKLSLEEIKKITEAFYMIDKSRTRKEGGAGIGMALCKKIINLHNAKWRIKSKPGKGTVISVTFPTM